MPTTKPQIPEVRDEVAALISKIARGGRDPETPAPVRTRGNPLIEEAAIRLLESLPPTLCLVALRGQFPRILNRIAHTWHDPRKFGALIASLLIDDRGQRQGFPFDVVNEITELREYYFTMVHPEARRAVGLANPRGFR